MGKSWVLGALRLARIPSTAVAFLVVFLPTYVHTHDVKRSLAVSIPLALISICIFILNDLNDLDRDRLNHPSRPLPAGLLSLQGAAALYFTAFVACLAVVQIFIDPDLRYIYHAGFLIAINYGLIVDYIPKLKNAYVALCASLPLILVSILTRSDPSFGAATGAFAFVLGREMLMDLRDAQGDGATVVKLFSSRMVTRFACALQGIGVLAFATTASTLLQLAATTLALVLFAFIWKQWRRGPQSLLLQLMKIQMICAIAFLL
jgi:4-hydroxybenzoate polyprenyltransferase